MNIKLLLVLCLCISVAADFRISRRGRNRRRRVRYGCKPPLGTVPVDTNRWIFQSGETITVRCIPKSAMQSGRYRLQCGSRGKWIGRIPCKQPEGNPGREGGPGPSGNPGREGGPGPSGLDSVHRIRSRCETPPGTAPVDTNRWHFLSGEWIKVRCITMSTIESSPYRLKCGSDGEWIGRIPDCKQPDVQAYSTDLNHPQMVEKYTDPAYSSVSTRSGTLGKSEGEECKNNDDECGTDALPKLLCTVRGDIGVSTKEKCPLMCGVCEAANPSVSTRSETPEESAREECKNNDDKCGTDALPKLLCTVRGDIGESTKEKCPLMCGVCEAANPSVSTRSETPEESAKEECKNHDEECGSDTIPKELCGVKARIGELTKEKCPLMCGICQAAYPSVSTRSETPEESAGECKNNDDKCGNELPKSLCEIDGKIGETMKEDCALLCGVCGEECKNNNDRCGNELSKSLCEIGGKIGETMKEDCALLCGVCISVS